MQEGWLSEGKSRLFKNTKLSPQLSVLFSPQWKLQPLRSHSLTHQVFPGHLSCARYPEGVNDSAQEFVPGPPARISTGSDLLSQLLQNRVSKFMSPLLLPEALFLMS